MKLKKIFYLIICNLLICNLQYGQNITNTLGTSGLFTIKDASSNFLTLSQSTGQVNILKTLRLENTTNSTTVLTLLWAKVLYIPTPAVFVIQH